MAKQITTNRPNYTTTETISYPVIPWNTDFRITEDEAGCTKVTSITTPLDASNDYVFKSQKIANIYSNSGVPNGLQSPVKSGVSLLNQNNEIWTKTDSEDASYQVNLPVSCHLVVKVPNDGSITPEMVAALISRTISGFYDSADDLSRLSAMLRQSLTPAGL